MLDLSPRYKLESRKKYQEHRQRLAMLQEVPEAIALCRTNFQAFRLLVCEHETYSHQKEWEKILITKNSSRSLVEIAGRDTLILAPRGSTKSTYLVELVAWVIGIHAAPEVKKAIKILLISYEKGTARQKSQQIQRIVTRPLYQQVFPWIRKGENWSKELWEIDQSWAGLSVTEEPYTLACTGLLGNTTGKRADLLILDDLLKSPEAIANPDIREEMANNFSSVIRPTRKDGGRAICLGTRMRPDSIYETHFLPALDLEDESDRVGWEVVEQSAILTADDGTEYSYWEPETPKAPGQPLAFLQGEREASPITFSYQFQNKILPLKTQAIEAGLITREMIPSKVETLILGVDLSASQKETADYTAMVLGAMTYEKRNGSVISRFWIIDCWESRSMGNREKLEQILAIWDTWKHLLPQTTKPINYNEIEVSPAGGLEIIFESNTYQASFQGDYNAYILGEKKMYDWRVIPSYSKGGKLERLRGVSLLFDNGMISFNLYGRLMGKLITQLTQFGSTPHDDLMDACVLCLQGLRSSNPISTGNYT